MLLRELELHRALRWYALCMQEGVGFQPYGLDLSNPDFVKYAEAYGARGYSITKASDSVHVFSLEVTRCELQICIFGASIQ